MILRIKRVSSLPLQCPPHLAWQGPGKKTQALIKPRARAGRFKTASLALIPARLAARIMLGIMGKAMYHIWRKTILMPVLSSGPIHPVSQLIDDGGRHH